MKTPKSERPARCPRPTCSPRFAVYPGDIRSQRDGDIHHIGFARLCELYNVPPALCVDMSRPENRVGRDISKLVALRPSYRGNYTLAASERGACPWDSDGDGDCHKCFNRPGGCSWENAKEHPTQKPLELLQWCIGKAGDAQTILDPFAGSGTTGEAAKLMGKKAVLIEREERYCEIAARRLAQDVLALDCPNAEVCQPEGGKKL